MQQTQKIWLEKSYPPGVPFEIDANKYSSYNTTSPLPPIPQPSKSLILIHPTYLAHWNPPPDHYYYLLTIRSKPWVSRTPSKKFVLPTPKNAKIIFLFYPYIFKNLVNLSVFSHNGLDILRNSTDSESIAMKSKNTRKSMFYLCAHLVPCMGAQTTSRFSYIFLIL